MLNHMNTIYQNIVDEVVGMLYAAKQTIYCGSYVS